MGFNYSRSRKKFPTYPDEILNIFVANPEKLLYSDVATDFVIGGLGCSLRVTTPDFLFH
jgi:hypothetical protein